MNSIPENCFSVNPVIDSQLIAPKIDSKSIPSLQCQCAQCWQLYSADKCIIQKTPRGFMWICLACDAKLRRCHATNDVRGAWGMIGRMVAWVEGKVAR